MYSFRVTIDLFDWSLLVDSVSDHFYNMKFLFPFLGDPEVRFFDLVEISFTIVLP